MSKEKNTGHNLELAFWRALYEENTQVPDYLLANYREIGLSDSEFIALLRVLACRQKNQAYITRDKLLRQWQGDTAAMSAALAALQRQGVLQPAADEAAYSLAGLYAKLLELWVFQRSVPAYCAPAQNTPARNLGEPQPEPEMTEVIKAAYQLFEGEFARPLSPLEMEKLNAWLVADRWDFAMLKEAMRRAVLHNALNLAYIDKILLRWRREGIASLAQLQAQEEQQAADKPAKKPREKNGRGKPKAAEPSFGSDLDYSQYF